MRSIVLSSLFCLAFASVGCAANTGAEGDGVSAESVVKEVGYGYACGGFMANAPVCLPGLTCSHVDAHGNPINPDLPGVCLEAVGMTCGGNMTTAHACAGGLRCVSSNPDVAGKCETVSQYNGPCGGFVANPAVCDVGLQCSHVSATGVVIFPDLPGVCLEGKGGVCGGFIANPKACASPLTCVKSNPDIAGTCQ
jgi:hypothetical protein